MLVKLNVDSVLQYEAQSKEMTRIVVNKVTGKFQFYNL